jgi:hypothetical protein
VPCVTPPRYWLPRLPSATSPYLPSASSPIVEDRLLRVRCPPVWRLIVQLDSQWRPAFRHAVFRRPYRVFCPGHIPRTKLLLQTRAILLRRPPGYQVQRTSAGHLSRPKHADVLPRLGGKTGERSLRVRFRSVALGQKRTFDEAQGSGRIGLQVLVGWPADRMGLRFPQRVLGLVLVSIHCSLAPPQSRSSEQ